MAIMTQEKPSRNVLEIRKATQQFSIRQTLESHLKEYSYLKGRYTGRDGEAKVLYPLTLWYNYETKEIVDTFTHGECYLPVVVSINRFTSRPMKMALQDAVLHLRYDQRSDEICDQALDYMAHHIEGTLTRRFEQAFADYEAYMLTNPSFEEAVTELEVHRIKGEACTVNVDVYEYEPYEIGEFYFNYARQLMVDSLFEGVHPHVLGSMALYLQTIEIEALDYRYAHIEEIFDNLYNLGKLESDQDLRSLYTIFIKRAWDQVSNSRHDSYLLKRRLKVDVLPFQPGTVDWNEEELNQLYHSDIYQYIRQSV